MNTAHYLLKLVVPAAQKALYEAAIEKHDMKNSGGRGGDAGFDLFCPEAVVVVGQQSQAIDQGVKGAMEFLSCPCSFGYCACICACTCACTKGTCACTESTCACTEGTNCSCVFGICAVGVGQPVGYFMYPRSSTGLKTPLRLANSVGVIDAGYRGNYIAVFDNVRTEPFSVEQGQRLVQICPPNLTYPLKVVLVDDLGAQTLRGERGFGSSGL
jgi:dUTPase